MTDNQSSLLGLLFIVGLFVAYGIERRKKRLARQPRPAEMPAPVLGDDRPSRSADFGCLPILTSFLLLLVATHRDDGWGYLWQGVLFVIVAVSAYTTLNPKEFEAARRWDPERTWTTHLLQMGVGLVLLPLLGWLLVVPVGWTPGFLVPAVPWALLLLAGYAAAAFGKRQT